MHRFSRVALAATTVVACASGSIPAAHAVAVREAETFWKQTCSWLVDENGDVLRDNQGNWVPALGPDGKQRCTTDPVPANAVKPGSSQPMPDTTSSSAAQAGEQPNWVDKDTSSSELGIGAVVGIVGAIIAALVGLGWLFVDALNVRVVPPRW